VIAVTFEQAIENAARCLQNAEGETNLAVLEQLEHLADSWISLANTLIAKEQLRP
jgi:hypothetical protein